MDFRGLAQRKEITKAGNDALDKYGCGSCGPRGFYGTIDVHIYLEQDIAKFYGAEDAIVYSDANSTPSSAIPAFSNRADILIVDDGVNDAILTGVNLSRSRTLFFKHNDMDDLKRLLIKIDNEDKKMKRSPQRRFVVVEGLYRNYGDIAPLDEIYKLKKEYKWRMFVDESHSVGTMGVTGRGVHEHFGLTINDIDICVASLSTTLASVGGFCVGTREVVEHQRLNGAGYTFSASSPPFVSTVGSASLKILTEESNLVSTLKKKAQFFHNQIAQIGKGFLVTTSNQASPLVHIRLDSQHTFAKNREEYNQDSEKRVEEEAILRNMSKILREEAGFYAPVANYVFNPLSGKTIGGSTKPTLPPPSIRVAITVNHEESELTALCIALCDTAKKCLSKN